MHAECRILVPWPGTDPCSLQWKCGVLTIGPPGMSLFVLFFFNFYCILEYRWFTTLCQFQVDSKVIQLYIHIQPFFFKFFSYTDYLTVYWGEFSVLYGRSLLIIYFIHKYKIYYFMYNNSTSLCLWDHQYLYLLTTCIGTCINKLYWPAFASGLPLKLRQTQAVNSPVRAALHQRSLGRGGWIPQVPHPLLPDCSEVWVPYRFPERLSPAAYPG